MDKLKAMLEKRKEEIKDKKVVSQAEIEAEKRRQYLAEQEKIEKARQDKQKRRLEELDKYIGGSPQKKVKEEDPVETRTTPVKTTSENVEAQPEEEPEEEPPLSKQEVIRRLRSMNEPVTFFGESDWKRYLRMRKLAEDRMDRHDQGGEGNTFQKDLEMNEDEFRRLQKIDDADGADLNFDNLLDRFEEAIRPFKPTEEEMKTRRKINLGGGLDPNIKHEYVYLWCRKLLKEWGEELPEMTKSAGDAFDARQVLGNYRQCRRYINPLLELLNTKSLNQEILDGLFNIAFYALSKEYVKAHDKYLELAIGNAPWPMGVTMVGIHERSGRSKIFTNQIAHILNDETQRKYIQSIKRLLTFSQKKYPTDPSKMVFK
eukprot:TRINITY_DN9781_c0_g1_i2.p1 TRINITY_DN9781_c0_g1~~TRINITY_DN9781_c0_g1_i2.p1  ORF type:complete len:373 (-),score=100.78 TRINITY_DN9781_c0_g1_i2:105-1223(-)